MKHRKYETTIVKFEIVSSSFFIRKHIKFDFNRHSIYLEIALVNNEIQKFYLQLELAK